MDLPKRLTTRQQNELEAQLTEGRQQQVEGAREFTTAEEMLRHDALHTPVPPSVESRLQESVEREGLQPARWWRRLFGRAKE